VTYLPENFRQPAPKVAEIEQPPNVHLIVRNNISAIFMAAASPSNISVSFPVPAKYGGWTTCVKATAQGVTGRSVGTQTYLVNIEHDQIGQRDTSMTLIGAPRRPISHSDADHQFVPAESRRQGRSAGVDEGDTGAVGPGGVCAIIPDLSSWLNANWARGCSAAKASSLWPLVHTIGWPTSGI